MSRTCTILLILAALMTAPQASRAQDHRTIDLNINLNIKNSGPPWVGCPCGHDHGKPAVAGPAAAAPAAPAAAPALAPVGGWTPDKIVKFYTETKDKNGKLRYLVEVPYGKDKKNVRRYYAVEGDILVTIDELTSRAEDLSEAIAYEYKLRQLEQVTKALAESNSFFSPAAKMQSADKSAAKTFAYVDGLRKHQLVLNLDQGRDDVWYHPAGSATRRNFATHPLTYCIRVDDFTHDEFEKLVDDLEIVTKGRGTSEGWENVCNVKFEYKESFNQVPDEVNGAPPQGVDFTVRKTTATSFVAAAFFPGEADYRRHVLVGPSYFTIDAQGINSTGVMRHELGHALGFRHEHIRVEAPRECPVEDLTDTRTLGPYDMYSVMHYLCGDAGTTHLNFSESDRFWANQIYPLPTPIPSPAAPELFVPLMLGR